MNFVPTVLGWFGGFWPRVGLIAVALASVVSWRAYDVHKQRTIGAERVTVEIKRQTDEINRKARAARDAAGAPGAAERVRKQYCVDC